MKSLFLSYKIYFFYVIIFAPFTVFRISFF